MRLLNRRFLIDNLCFLHGTMIASVPMLRLALLTADGGLAGYYKKHIAQERGHDEMLRKDLALMGVTQIPKYHAAAQIAGAQYYLIRHEHPALLLGYMLTLENNVLSPEFIAKLEHIHGVSLSCMAHHAKHDPQHAEELKHQISIQPAELQARIDWNAQCTLYAVATALNGIWENIEKSEALSA